MMAPIFNTLIMSVVVIVLYQCINHNLADSARGLVVCSEEQCSPDSKNWQMFSHVGLKSGAGFAMGCDVILCSWGAGVKVVQSLDYSIMAKSNNNNFKSLLFA